MPINNNLISSWSNEELSSRIEEVYKDLSDEINGTYRKHNNLYVYGSSSAGDAKYIQNESIYWLQGRYIDYWLYYMWSDHTGTGKLRIKLPIKGYSKTIIPQIGICSMNNIPYPANTTNVNLVIDPGKDYIKIISRGQDSNNEEIDIKSSGSITGYIRYMIHGNI